MAKILEIHGGSLGPEASRRGARLVVEVNLPMSNRLSNAVSKPLRIMKFGGTSVGDASAIQKVVDIIRGASRDRDLWWSSRP